MIGNLITAIKEYETDAKVRDMSCQLSISSGTFQSTGSKTARALVGLGRSQQSFDHQRILTVQLSLIPIACLSDAMHNAGQADTEAVLGHAFDGHLTALRWPYNSPSSAS